MHFEISFHFRSDFSSNPLQLVFISYHSFLSLKRETTNVFYYTFESENNVRSIAPKTYAGKELNRFRLLVATEVGESREILWNRYPLGGYPLGWISIPSGGYPRE